MVDTTLDIIVKNIEFQADGSWKELSEENITVLKTDTVETSHNALCHAFNKERERCKSMLYTFKNGKLGVQSPNIPLKDGETYYVLFEQKPYSAENRLNDKDKNSKMVKFFSLKSQEGQTIGFDVYPSTTLESTINNIYQRFYKSRSRHYFGLSPILLTKGFKDMCIPVESLAYVNLKDSPNANVINVIFDIVRH